MELSERELTRQLIVIDGVPNHTYLVKSGKVFVFSRFLSLVWAEMQKTPGAPLRTIAKDCLPHAFISIEQAVMQLGVRPSGFVIATHNNDYTLYHRQLNAITADRFSTMELALEGACKLLQGHFSEGPGTPDYILGHIPLYFVDPYRVELLKMPPLGPDGFKPVIVDDKWSKMIPFSKSDAKRMLKASRELKIRPQYFYTLCSFTESLKLVEDKYVPFVTLKLSEVWSKCHRFEFEKLNLSVDVEHIEIPSVVAEVVALLRELYPELHMLTPYTLITELRSCTGSFRNATQYGREDAFVLHLIGRVALSGMHDDDLFLKGMSDADTTSLGLIIAYHYLHTDSITGAFAFGIQYYKWFKKSYEQLYMMKSALNFILERREGDSIFKGDVVYEPDIFFSA